MKRTIGMSIQLHNEAKLLADKERRISDIAALCDAAKRGGIALDRALTEIIETAQGDAASVVRVGEQKGHTPEVRT